MLKGPVPGERILDPVEEGVPADPTAKTELVFDETKYPGERRRHH